MGSGQAGRTLRPCAVPPRLQVADQIEQIMSGGAGKVRKVMHMNARNEHGELMNEVTEGRMRMIMSVPPNSFR